MRRPLVVGNWKMNNTRGGSKSLLRDLIVGMEHDIHAQVGVCVPFLYIPDASEQLAGTSILLGSQSVADHRSGAFTGEISATMLKEFNCQTAIVGHSERRILYGESNALVAARFQQAIAGDLRPILCVGETLEQRDSGRTFDIIEKQLAVVLNSAGVGSMGQAVIAYEPVWAIGSGKTASTEQAQEVHAFIRGRIASKSKTVAEGLRILYGGSVNPDNASELFAAQDIDGGLIGGASLDATAFLSICNSV